MPLNTSTPSRLFHAKLGAAEADVNVINHASGAVPAGYKYIVTCVTVSNSDTSSRYVLLRFVPSGETPGDEHNILSGSTKALLAAGDTRVFFGRWALHAGDKVRGSCSSANKITVRGDGIIITET